MKKSNHALNLGLNYKLNGKNYVIDGCNITRPQLISLNGETVTGPEYNFVDY